MSADPLEGSTPSSPHNLPKADWFRRSTWTAQDEAEFQASLGRSRSIFHKAQYLRIQAAHLAAVGTEPLIEAALRLLDQLISQFPHDSQLALAFQQRASCLVDLGRHAQALAAYEAALAAERAFPNLRTGAVLDYGELAIALHRTDLYPRIEWLLNEMTSTSGPQFPVGDYQYSVVRAFLAAERKDWAAVRTHAARALAAASKTESPFRYHRKLGLVSFVDPKVVEQLQKWCAV